MIIQPQPGPQQKFLECNADIAFYGGAAGGGKTFSLLMDPLYDMEVPGFGGVLFRRTVPQITNEGALWDQSMNIYSNVEAIPKSHGHYWVFPGGNTMSFAGMEHEKNKFDWQGSEIPWIGFDELTHFTRTQFFYMLSRNRSTCGVRPRIRAGMNPEKKSWVRKFIDWWLYPKATSPTGRATPIPERSGVVRYFMVENDVVIWKDRREDFDKPELAKSFTFIGADVYDNKILLEKDPNYLANLHALPKVERDKLLGGDWDAEEAPGEFFDRSWFRVIKGVKMHEISAVIRYWDRASSEEDTADYTVGLLYAKMKDGSFVVLDVDRFRGKPGTVESRMMNVAVQDLITYGSRYSICFEQDPGQAGEADVLYLVKKFAGFNVKINRATKAKTVRALPVSSQAENGNILIVEGKWNDDFFQELEAFPLGAHDDQVDTLSGASAMLIGNPVGAFTEDMTSSNKEDPLKEW